MSGSRSLGPSSKKRHRSRGASADEDDDDPDLRAAIAASLLEQGQGGGDGGVGVEANAKLPDLHGGRTSSGPPPGKENAPAPGAQHGSGAARNSNKRPRRDLELDPVQHQEMNSTGLFADPDDAEIDDLLGRGGRLDPAHAEFERARREQEEIEREMRRFGAVEEDISGREDESLGLGDHDRNEERNDVASGQLDNEQEADDENDDEDEDEELVKAALAASLESERQDALSREKKQQEYVQQMNQVQQESHELEEDEKKRFRDQQRSDVSDPDPANGKWYQILTNFELSEGILEQEEFAELMNMCLEGFLAPGCSGGAEEEAAAPVDGLEPCPCSSLPTPVRKTNGQELVRTKLWEFFMLRQKAKKWYAAVADAYCHAALLRMNEAQSFSVIRDELKTLEEGLYEMPDDPVSLLPAILRPFSASVSSSSTSHLCSGSGAGTSSASWSSSSAVAGGTTTTLAAGVFATDYDDDDLEYLGEAGLTSAGRTRVVEEIEALGD